MSAEGDTNLDNDGAADCLVLFSEHIFHRITELLNHPNGHEYDDGYISELFALVEVVFALHAKGLVYACPSPQDILPLFDPFFASWATYHQEAGHDPPHARRISMRETFEALEQIVMERAQSQEEWVEAKVDPSNPHDVAIREIFDDLSK